MEEQKRTVFAGKAFGLAELFKHTVGKERLEVGPVTYVPELSAPEGESTGGGKQSLQHIALVPQGGGATLVIGTADLVGQRAELRGFAQVDDVHRRRFKGAPFPVERPRYEALLQSLQTFFSGRQYQVTVVGAPAAPPAPAAGVASSAEADDDAPPRSSPPWRLVLGLAVAAAVVVGAIALLR